MGMGFAPTWLRQVSLPPLHIVIYQVNAARAYDTTHIIQTD